MSFSRARAGLALGVGLGSTAACGAFSSADPGATVEPVQSGSDALVVAPDGGGGDALADAASEAAPTARRRS